MNSNKAVFCWSGGKDSALALYRVLKEGRYEVVSLLTTVNEEFRRVSMHGVREELLEMQASSIGLPLVKMYLGKGSSNEDYEKAMEKLLLDFKSEGVEHVIFGDIFLEDLKKYREANLARVGLKAVFPLWKEDTRKLASEFIDLGLETVICCTNNDFFDDSYVGRFFDRKFIDSLPENVDICGENGEFHSFAFNGPVFKEPIRFTIGEKVLKTYEAKCMDDGDEKIQIKGYWFIDLMPA